MQAGPLNAGQRFGSLVVVNRFVRASASRSPGEATFRGGLQATRAPCGRLGRWPEDGTIR